MPSNDPRWTTARRASKCVDCPRTISKGDSMFYYPIGKHTLCVDCGREAYNDWRTLNGEAF